MLKQLATGALAAFTVAAALAAGEAEAGTRLRFHYAPFYGDYEPEWVPPPRYYYYYEEPEPYRRYEYDEGYYEPEYLGPDAEPEPLKPRKKAKPAVSESNVAKKKSAVRTASIGETTPKPAAALSCDKATAIVSGYGFATVKAEDCEGKVYAFKASRDGKAYAIKLNAGSGELTEVKKLR